MVFSIFKLMGLSDFEVEILKEIMASSEMVTVSKYYTAAIDNPAASHQLHYAMLLECHEDGQYGTHTAEIKLWTIRKGAWKTLDDGTRSKERVDIITPSYIFDQLQRIIMDPRSVVNRRLHSERKDQVISHITKN